MSDVIRVQLPISEIGARPSSGDFEQRCLEAAEAKLAKSMSGADDVTVCPGVVVRHRVVDIDIEGDNVIVILGEQASPRQVDPPAAGLRLADDSDLPACAQACDEACACGHDHGTPEGAAAPVEAAAMDGPMDIPIENSAAWEGPLADRTFEVSVVDMCALLDLMGFAQQLSQATHAISPTIARSMHKLESMMAEAIGEEGDGGGTRPSPDFLEHMNTWMTESTELFNRVAQASQRRVVRAQMMPGADFDPTGGMGGGQQGPPPLYRR